MYMYMYRHYNFDNKLQVWAGENPAIMYSRNPAMHVYTVDIRIHTFHCINVLTVRYKNAMYTCI